MPDLKGSFRKIKDFFRFNVPSIELTPEREQETIEKITNYTVKFGLGAPSGASRMGF